MSACSSSKRRLWFGGFVTALILVVIPVNKSTGSISSFLNLPKNMIIPDFMGTPISPPRLTTGGYPLIMSNAPETLHSYTKPAAFYRVQISKKRFRVFFHHMNASGRPLNIGIAVTNPSSTHSSTQVFLSRNSQLLPGKSTSTVDKKPSVAGWLALRNWLQSRSGDGKDSWLCDLKPGATKFLLQRVPAGSTVTGMYDFALKSSGSRDQNVKVIVSVLTCDTPPAHPEKLSVLPPGSKTWYRRGTFNHCDRYGTIDCDVSVTPCVDLAGPPTGRFSRLMANELEVASDDPRGFNPGNYGVIYNFKVNLRNPMYSNLRTLCLLHAAGGPGYSCTTLDGKFKEHPKRLSAYEGWIFKDIKINPGSTASFNIQFSLPGGSSGAHRLYFWPFV